MVVGSRKVSFALILFLRDRSARVGPALSVRFEMTALVTAKFELNALEHSDRARNQNNYDR